MMPNLSYRSRDQVGSSLMTGVVAGHLERSRCRIILDESAERSEVWARVAVAPPYVPRLGDRVLIAGQPPGGAYIIGVLALAKDRSGASDQTLAARDGSSVRLRSEDGAETFELCDREGRLLFSYDPVKGTGVLSVPAGDLSLCAPSGDVRIAAGNRLELFSAGPTRIHSVQDLELAVGSVQGDSGTRLRMKESELRVDTKRFSLLAEAGQFALVRPGIAAPRSLPSCAGRRLW